MKNFSKRAAPVGAGGITRRRFVQGLAAGGTVAALGYIEKPVWAVTQNAPVQELSGTEFDLTIEESPVNITGNMAVATTVNGQMPAPLLRWREGDTVTLRVTNRLKVPTSIHWHGIVVPNAMDGVPGMTFNGIGPGETFTYRFPVRQSGTYWYHSHSGFQEQTGLFGPLVIEPRESAPYRVDREHVVILSDWTDESPEHVYSRLKKMDGYYNYAKPTFGDLIEDIRKEGFSKALASRGMWDQMRMSPRDFADVSGETYTYLMNGASPAGNWTALFQHGQKVLLRFINGSAMTYFDVRIPGLKMTVVAADGQYVNPVAVDEIRMGVAETYDVIVEPQDGQAYTIFAQSMDRSGYARGTLAPRAGMSAAVPEVDPVPTLTMADMGMGSHEGMDMTGHGASGSHTSGATSEMPTTHHDMGMSSHSMAGMAAATHGSAPDDSQSANTTEMPSHHGMGMSHDGETAGTATEGSSDGAMAGTHQGHMGNTDPSPGASGHPNSAPTMDHGGHSMSMDSPSPESTTTTPGTGNRYENGMMEVRHHPATEDGPGNSMQATVVSTRLDDPGVGLRDNGRRVLTYADLRGLGTWLNAREPSRTIEFHLTGNMQRYMWSFDGVQYSEAMDPIRLAHGDVVRMVLVNDTMMEHPIHLHGMWSELENAEGGFQVRKHTVNVKPGHAVVLRVHADAPGRWPFHCHLLYHMEGGMFREVKVS